jgi:hypothetical protein
MATATDHEIDLGTLERTGRKVGLELQDIARIIGVDQSTLYRWRTGASVPRPIVRTRLVQFGELFALLRRLFAGPDVARRWLHEARPVSLGGAHTPLDVMRQGRIDRVLLLLHALGAGG